MVGLLNGLVVFEQERKNTVQTMVYFSDKRQARMICVRYRLKVLRAIKRGETCRVMNAAWPMKSSSRLQDSFIGL